MALECAQLSWRKRANRSARQRAKAQRTKARARQRQHRMLQRFKHPANLAIAPLVKRQVDEAVIAPNGDDANLCAGRAKIAEANPMLERPYVFGAEPPGDRRPVRLLHAEARVKQPVSKFAVVGD